MDSKSKKLPEVYFIYEKAATHLDVAAGPDGQFPVEQVASLLAMRCLTRGQSPNDYLVMVPVASAVLAGLTGKVDKLLQVGRAANASVRLTRRQDEVLAGVMRSLANKEIAADLHLSERTVKFHVSSLLAKFHVRGRLQLVREVLHVAVHEESYDHK